MIGGKKAKTLWAEDVRKWMEDGGDPLDWDWEDEDEE